MNTEMNVEMSGKWINQSDAIGLRDGLKKYERSKIIEIYFARLDGRDASDFSLEFDFLFKVELEDIRLFLLNQQPQDLILSKVLELVKAS